MIDGNRLGAVGLEKLGTPYGQMDCQAFIEWCLARCGLRKDLAGSNAWYREVLRNGWAGSPEECVKKFGKVPAGAFLFIHAFDGGEPAKYRPDGLGNASHIGIVTGQGEGAVHSSSSRGCVAESRFTGKSISGGWNKVGLWLAQVRYDGIAGTEPAGDGEPDPAAEAAPEPELSAEYAAVWAGQGTTVNTRQGPGVNYAMSKAGRVPVGTVVEILKRVNGWCRIRYTDPRGAAWYCWMKEEFLLPAREKPEPAPGEILYTAVVSHLTASEAARLKEVYPACEIREEAG